MQRCDAGAPSANRRQRKWPSARYCDCDAQHRGERHRCRGPFGRRRCNAGRHGMVRVGNAHPQRHSGGADRTPRFPRQPRTDPSRRGRNRTGRACSPVSLRRDRFPTLRDVRTTTWGEIEMAATQMHCRATRSSSSTTAVGSRPVYRRGSGPAVIIIHEMPGMHPLVIRFADHVRRGRHDRRDAEPVRVAGTRSDDGARGSA